MNIENCPNLEVSENGEKELKKTYTDFQEVCQNNSNEFCENHGQKEYNEICFGICPTKDPDGNDVNYYYTDILGCKKCPDNFDIPFISQDRNIQNELTTSMRTIEQQCSRDNLDWFEYQKSVYLDQFRIVLNKSDWKITQTESNLLDNYDIFNVFLQNRTKIPKKYLNNNPEYSNESDLNALSKKELIEIINNKGRLNTKLGWNSNNYYDSPFRNYNLIDKNELLSIIIINDKFKFSELRKDINEIGGLNLGYDSKQIIKKEVLHYINQNSEDIDDGYNDDLFDKLDKDNSGTVNESEFKKHIMNNNNNILYNLIAPSVNEEFIECSNKLLETKGFDEIEIQSDIKNANSLSELEDKHIKYIKAKFNKLRTIHYNDFVNCIEHLNIIERCPINGITEESLYIGILIFKTMNNDKIDLNNLSNEDTNKLNMILKEIGPIVPKAIKNLIELSKEYESTVCGGISGKTIFLEEMVNKLLIKRPEVTIQIPEFNPFSRLTEIDDNWTFVRTYMVMLLVFYCFFKTLDILFSSKK